MVINKCETSLLSFCDLVLLKKAAKKIDNQPIEYFFTHKDFTEVSSLYRIPRKILMTPGLLRSKGKIIKKCLTAIPVELTVKHLNQRFAF